MIKNFVFLGTPGVGKGSISQKVMLEKGIIHISTGAIFRKHIKNKTLLGLAVSKILASGKYVTDEIVNEIVKERLKEADVKKHGFILDGYPRTINQAKFLNTLIGKSHLQVVLLNARDEVIAQRLAKRAKEENRQDDSDQVIRDRIAIYTNKTAPLIKYYDAKSQLIKISAESTIEENVENFYKECLVGYDQK